MNHSKINSIVNSIKTPIHSRIAPTPSGFLHKGNAFSFLLTWMLVRKTNGTLTLRIDDMDKNRKRPEYMKDIFETLHFLGIDYDKGAKNPDDFEAHYSQHHFLDIYQKETEILKSKNAVFKCFCSRSEIQARNNKNGIKDKNKYDGFCLNRIDLKSENQKKYALRIDTDYFDEKEILINDCLNDSYRIDITTQIPFFIIEKKAQKGIKLPAYQLTSLIDDERMNSNFIVRGKDLIVSTAAQLFLAKILNKKSFLETTFLHHDLILDEENNKISKSAGSKYDNFSIKYFRENGGTRESFLKQFYEWVNDFM